LSRENLEIVRRMLEASDRRDGAAVFAVYDPETEWDVSEPSPTEPHYEDPIWMRGVFRGHDAVRRWLREWVGGWEVTDYQHEQLIDAGDQVVHFVRQHVRGRASGIEFEFPPCAQVWTVRGGKIVRMKLYWSRQDALESAALRQ
jgi:ketosteroid isomerase-like protein